jgi:hypothetical protein
VHSVQRIFIAMAVGFSYRFGRTLSRLHRILPRNISQSKPPPEIAAPRAGRADSGDSLNRRPAACDDRVER